MIPDLSFNEWREIMENTNVVSSVTETTTTTVATKGKRGVRPAVQLRKSQILESLKGLLGDGKARGPSEIARELATLGFTDLSTWTDAYHLLKSSGLFSETFIEGQKRAKYFLTPTVQETVPEAVIEEIAPPTVDIAPVQEAEVLVPRKGKTKKAA